MLGIPTVQDRVIQQAIAQILVEAYDPHFSNSSYGFRPGRSALEAIEQASRYIKGGEELGGGNGLGKVLRHREPHDNGAPS